MALPRASGWRYGRTSVPPIAPAAPAGRPPAARTFSARVAASASHRAWDQVRLGEPGIERLAAALVHRALRLRRAFRIVGRAVEAHMKMPVMPPPRLHLAQPGAVAAGIAAQCLLDGGIHEDARNGGSSAAALISATCAGDHTLGSTSLRSAATTIVAIMFSRSSRVSSRSGICVNQMSLSRPT